MTPDPPPGDTPRRRAEHALAADAALRAVAWALLALVDEAAQIRRELARQNRRR